MAGHPKDGDDVLDMLEVRLKDAKLEEKELDFVLGEKAHAKKGSRCCAKKDVGDVLDPSRLDEIQFQAVTNVTTLVQPTSDSSEEMEM